MAEGTASKLKTFEMFWTRDDSLLEEKGLLNAGNKRPQPMAKGHTVKEVKAVIPVRQTAMKSDKYNTKDQSSEKIAERKAQCKEASIKDLCKEDKKRVADLINELARLGEERESALRSLQDERRVYDEQVRVLQQQQHQAICDRDYIQQELWECQLLLAQYQQQIVKELNKKDCTSQELKANKESSAQKKCKRSQKPRMKDTDVSTKHHRDRTPTRDTYSEPVDELRYKHKDDQHSNYSTEIKTVDKRCGAEVEYYSTGSIQSDDRTSHNAKPKHKTSIQQHKAPNGTRRVHIPTSPLSRQFTQKLDHLIHKHNGTDNQDSSIAEKENEDPIISRQMLGLNQVDKRRIRCLNSDTDTVITETDAPSVATTTPGARYDKPDIRSTKRSSDTAAPLIAEFLSSTQKSDTSTIPLLPPTLPLSRHASTIHSEDFHPLIPDAISASRSTVATAECEASPRDIDHTPQLLIDIPNVEPTVSRATTASRRETSYNSNMQCNGNADSRGTRVCDTECVAGDNTHVSHDAAYHHGTDTTTHITHTHHAKREAGIATYGDAAVSSATVNHVPVSTAISSVAGNTAVNDPTSRADTVTSTTKTVGFSSLVEAQDVNLTHNVDESNTEEQRLKLQAQRRALLEEQERLKTILAEQENLLLIKQHQLQQQHLEQQHRLQEFHRTGTFPDDFIPCGPTSTTQQYNDLCVTALPAQLPANRGEQMYNYAPVYTSGGALVNADNYARSSEYDRRDGVDRQHHPQPQPLRTTFVNYSQPQYQAECRTTQQFGSNVLNQYNCGITVDKLHAGDAHCKSVEKQIPDTLVEPVPSEHVTVLQQTQVNGQLAADDQHLQQASLQSFQSRAGMLRHKQMPDASKTSSLEKSPARRLKKSEGARTTQHTERYSFTKRDDKAELINAVELLNPVSTQSDSRDTSYMTDHDIEESRILGDVFFIS